MQLWIFYTPSSIQKFVIKDKLWQIIVLSPINQKKCGFCGTSGWPYWRNATGRPQPLARCETPFFRNKAAVASLIILAIYYCYLLPVAPWFLPLYLWRYRLDMMSSPPTMEGVSLLRYGCFWSRLTGTYRYWWTDFIIGRYRRSFYFRDYRHNLWWRFPAM